MTLNSLFEIQVLDIQILEANKNNICKVPFTNGKSLSKTGVFKLFIKETRTFCKSL